jgi:ribonuclease HI
MITDASQTGWGAIMEVKKSKYFYHGDFSISKRELTSSNQRETAAVMLGLRQSMSVLKENQVRVLGIESDNTTTVSNLARVRGAESMLWMVREIFKMLEAAQITLIPKYRPGVENTNADALSRLEAAGDYALDGKTFHNGLEQLKEKEEKAEEMVEIDMFATRWNTKLPRYVSPDPDPEAEELDAFSLNWQGRRVYAHPPIRMIARTLLRIELEKVETVMVVPDWPSQPWWPRLMEMTWKQVKLGKAEEVLTPGRRMRARGTKLPPGDMMMVRISWQR